MNKQRPTYTILIQKGNCFPQKMNSIGKRFQVYNLKTAGEPKMFAGNREKRAPDSKHLIQG